MNLIKALATFLFIPFAYCNSFNTAKNFSTTKWINTDSSGTVSYTTTKEGQGVYKAGGLPGIELVEMIRKDNGAICSKNLVDSFKSYYLITAISQLFTGGLEGKLKKNSEGYIKVNLSKRLGSEFKLDVYFSPLASETFMQSMESYLHTIREIDSVKYISPTDALWKYSAENDSDWVSAVKKNPLPASFEIKLRDGYVTAKNIEYISSLIKEKNVYSPEIIYSTTTLALIERTADYFYIFHFKT